MEKVEASYQAAKTNLDRSGVNAEDLNWGNSAIVLGFTYPMFERLKEEVRENEKKKEDKEGKINWLDGDWFDDWEKVKWDVKDNLGHGKDYDGEKIKLFFSAHSKDTIKGKPQLIDNVKKRIPLVRMAVKKRTEGKGEDKIDRSIVSFYFFDDKFDKRYDGYQRDAFALDFWIYRVQENSGKEYYIFSEKKLPNETCELKGMLIELDDFAEMSRSMKIKSLSRIFILKEFESAVKIISKEKLIEFTKTNKITEEDWFKLLAQHQFGSYNRFPKEMEYLKSAFVLSGKKEDYPLHLAVVGSAGTRKTMGHIETLAWKFSDEAKIIEGADSRIKGLSPSFKEKPANIGYLAKCDRMGWIDEVGKMVEFESNKHQGKITNTLGELNFLLEHKSRTVSSGNDNEVSIKASGKFMFVTNPVANKSTIYDHIGLIDPTTMSRILWWVQDKQEVEFVLSEKGIVKIPPIPTQAQEGSVGEEKEKGYLDSCMCWGCVKRSDFLTIFDSCYHFTTILDDLKILELVEMSSRLAKEPMKTSVWRPRAAHHISLLVDGLCKHRCLFKDYDVNFEPKDDDYELAKAILVRMIKSWDTVLTPKQPYNRSGRL